MKKYFILAAAAIAAMAACSKVESGYTPVQNEIRFSVINHVQQTRAHDLPYAGLSYPTSVPFGTFAWWTLDDWTGIATDQTYVFMDNEQISYQNIDNNNVWAPSSTYYWTKSGKITFASYSPYTASGTDKGYSEIPVYNVANGFLFNAYSIVEDTDIDLMYADLAANCGQNTNLDGSSVTDGVDSGFAGVPTVFNHALCRLSFAFRAIGHKNPNVDRIVIEVSDVDIFNIDSLGTFTQSASTKWATSHASAKTDYEYAPASVLELDLIDDTPANVSSTSNYTDLGVSRILMPQELLTSGDALNVTTDQIVRINYTIKTHYLSAPADESDPKYWAVEDLSAKVRLNNGNIAAWRDNQNITYRISINPNGIKVTFDPAVAPWTDIYSSDIPISAND
ncbi:MAG: fimbrillin family protein [Bacteroidales bacterium]|nr:fimbrillin family protein [Bacteroidales bacterium]